MAAAINHEAVVRIAREVFPGLVETNILVAGPAPKTSWNVTINIPSLLTVLIWAPVEATSCLGQAGHGMLDMELAAMSSLSTEDGVRRFLTECRDSFVANLTYGLTAALGPVRVLPRYTDLECMTPEYFAHVHVYLRAAVFPSVTIGVLLDAYAAEVARRRAERTAKPTGS